MTKVLISHIFAVRNLQYLTPSAGDDFPVFHDVRVLARRPAELGRLPVVVHHKLQGEETNVMLTQNMKYALRYLSSTCGNTSISSVKS